MRGAYAHFSLVLQPQHISKIIEDSLKVDFPEDKYNIEIEFDISESTEGYGMSERLVTNFSGATVKIYPKV